MGSMSACIEPEIKIKNTLWEEGITGHAKQRYNSSNLISFVRNSILSGKIPEVMSAYDCHSALTRKCNEESRKRERLRHR